VRFRCTIINILIHFVFIAELDKIGRRQVVVNEEKIALFSKNNKVYAVQTKCPHYGKRLVDLNF
jgi:nitrite reductase/ring-hydroxylating ferredoxin subunit